MIRFTKFTLLIAMLLMASNSLYAAPDPTVGPGTGGYSTVAGFANNAEGDYSTSVGYLNRASGLQSSAFGYQNTAEAEVSSAFGYQNTAEAEGSSAFGYQNTASGEGSSAFGYWNLAEGLYSNTFGIVNTASGEKSSAFGYNNTAKVNYSSAFGYKNKANGIFSSVFGTLSSANAPCSTAIGYEAVASEEKTVSFGHSAGDLDVNNEKFTSDRNVRLVHVATGTADTDAVNYGQLKAALSSGGGADEELQKTVKQHTENINKLLAELGTSKDKKENKPSDGSIAIGDSNVSGGTDKVAMAIGSENEVTGKNSIAIGYSIDGQHNEVSGDYSIAVGFGHKVSGNKSGAFGDPNIVSGAGSYAFGNDNTISGNGSFILGNNSKITADNSVALGNNITVAHNNAVAIGEGSKTTADNTVSVGSESNKRRITNVAKAEDDFDAVNYDQLKSYVAAHAGGGDPQEVLRLRSDMGKLDSRISKVGAGAAALVALKPMEFDPDNRWSAGVGFGNLNGKSAAAVGIFYRPNRDVYYSLGGNVGGEENIVNAGVSFSFGHRSERSIVKQYNSAEHAELEAFRNENAGLKDKVAAQDAKIAAQAEEIASQKDEIASQKDEIVDLKTRMKRLERLIIKMSKEDK